MQSWPRRAARTATAPWLPGWLDGHSFERNCATWLLSPGRSTGQPHAAILGVTVGLLIPHLNTCSVTGLSDFRGLTRIFVDSPEWKFHDAPKSHFARMATPAGDKRGDGRRADVHRSIRDLRRSFCHCSHVEPHATFCTSLHAKCQSPFGRCFVRCLPKKCHPRGRQLNRGQPGGRERGRGGASSSHAAPAGKCDLHHVRGDWRRVACVKKISRCIGGPGKFVMRRE